MTQKFRTTSLALATLCLSASSLAQVPDLNLQLDKVTVSGLSSGGYMANQFHLAYSDWVKGAGLLASGPYFCGQNDITVALSQCVDKVETPLDISKLGEQASQWAQQNKIAPLDNLADSKVWMLHGTLDNRVNQKVTDALYSQYLNWVPQDAIEYINDKPLAHLFPTLSEGGDCMKSESPFIGQCDFDAAGAMLSHLLGELEQPDDTLSGEVISFSQSELAGEDASTMGETGYAYVPQSCQQGEACQVHISFHGCNQYAEAIGTDYVEHTGLNRWADDNQLVVVYPQTKKSLFMPLNPQGCWDWWGYTGDDYATAGGKQLKAVKAIVEAMSQKKGS